MTTTVSPDEDPQGAARTVGLPVQPQFTIEDHGTLVSITPLTTAARTWLDENAITKPWQWLGGVLMVEHRYADALVSAMEEAL